MNLTGKTIRPGQRVLPRTVVMLGIVSFCTDAASEMIYPLIPLFVSALGSGALVLGLIEGAADSTSALLKLAGGVISDRWRRRKALVLAGYTLSSLVRPLVALVGSAWQITAVRVTDRVGKGIRTAPRDALIASSVESGNRGRAYGFHRAMDHAGAVTGPLLALGTILLLVLAGGLTDTLLLFRWTFFLALIPGLLAVLVCFYLVEERIDRRTGDTSLRGSIGRIGRNAKIYFAVITLFTLGNSSDAFLLFRVHETVSASGALYQTVLDLPVLGEMIRRLDGTEMQKSIVDIIFIPFLWSFFHLVKVLFSTRLGALSDRIGRKVVISIGWTIYVCVYVTFAFLENLSGSWVIGATFLLFTVYAFFYAFSEGAERAFVSDLVPADLRGTAFGLFHLCVGLGSLPASLLFGFLYATCGGMVAFGTGAGIAALSMLFLLLFVQEPERTEIPKSG